MASGDIPCFGDSCQKGVEFCDKLSQFCIACSNRPWKTYCFTSKHIENCTEYCRGALANIPLALELPDRPKNEPEGDEHYIWPIVLLVIVLLVFITAALVILIRKYWIRINVFCRSFVDDEETFEDKPKNTDDNNEVEAATQMLIKQPASDPVDPSPVQVSEGEATGSKDYPTFGPTALENHEETKLI